ncbi:thiopeptide-type bacteriocin biosynthesis domain-containing protein [Lentzea xinjiangensis]|uniref:Thiopeptide-type bacteriocin biosynthesis domain-containing protein n=1 Tax=Lentzea xinjiangensis TaxID=402600 RepID=A0A1H9W3Y3_9PSEU|nr:lantibiotic dehydratase [Lentzea xinjiangensis]SES28514.1 thiopeptide-type bacteriocin biosynthesis domain-containing protein [Lentzea xinjiangensis]
MQRFYDVLDAALIRATTIPNEIDLPPWPDLEAEDVTGWTDWLRRLWRITEFAAAVHHASPVLSAAVHKTLDSPGRPVASSRELRRVVDAVSRYLLRWQSRATPYGRFAGVAPVRLAAPAAVRWGTDHQVRLQPDALALHDQIRALEARLAVLRKANVVTNSLGFARGSRWVVPAAATPETGTGASLCDVEIELTAPVRLAIDTGRRPVPFAELTASLAATAPQADTLVIETMLAGLVAHSVLISSIRPAMTTTDPAGHLARFTADAPRATAPPAAALRLDCAVCLPDAVLREAEYAALILARIAPPVSGWAAYHQDFLERYGPHTAVPVREVVSGSGLGYPAGYRGSHRHEARDLGTRAVTLLTIAQRAALQRHHEVVLGDTLITRLTGEQRQPVPHTELRFHLAAPTPGDLDRGDFTLWISAAARHAGVTAGRFLHLFDPAERERFQRAYTHLPTQLPDALIAQMSVPPLAPRMTAVAQVPEILPVLTLGEYRDTAEHGEVIEVDDLAVVADAHRMWLVSLSRDRPVEPLLLNAVDLAGGQQPLARFLTEISTARCAPCRPVTWGALARDLPFLPRLRHGRSILHPARWRVEASELPPSTASHREWRAGWEQLRGTYRIPAQVFLGAADTRVRLDLDEPAHLTLLRRHLARHATAILTEPGDPAGWLHGRAHEVMLTLARTPAEQPTPWPRQRVATASTTAHQPGRSRWLYAKLYGRVDDILHQVPALGDAYSPASWFIRYHNPAPHLRLRLALRDDNEFACTARRLGVWADRLRDAGVLADYTLDTYRPEPRFGTGATLAAAEAVFAADSRTVLTHLHLDPVARTAAGMIAITAGFADNGLTWLLEHVDHHGHRPADRVAQHRDTVIDTARHRDTALQTALARYRTLAQANGLDTDQVLTDLLHLHHARSIGPDLTSERYCLRLARTAAKTMLLRDAS